MRIGSYFGIPLYVNPFFFLLLGAAVFFGKLAEALLLFAIVFWHESWHVIFARLYGLEVIQVELLPFGGVARLEALLQLNPQIEWIIAIVGPLSNIFLVLLAYALSPHFDIPLQWFDFFIQANLGMALFNLLPALPLDGGRVLRSILGRKRGFKQATDLAANVGKVLSVLVVLAGAFGIYLGHLRSFAALIAGVVLFFAARNEQRTSGYVFMRYLTHKKQELRLKRVQRIQPLIATAETSLGEILRHFQPPHYHLIWVTDSEGKILGCLGELELLSALFEQGLSYKVGALVNYRL